MQLAELPIPGAFTVLPKRHGDERGYFSEVFKKPVLDAHGITADFIQDNQSMSAPAGTLRGLHCQLPPFEQAKLVHVLHGKIRDVIVDYRPASPAFGQSYALDLDAETGMQVFVPRGCLHGFVTLSPNTVVSYKVDNPYAPASERSVRWDDPDLEIDWQLPGDEPTLSSKDRNGLSWAEFEAQIRTGLPSTPAGTA